MHIYPASYLKLTELLTLLFLPIFLLLGYLAPVHFQPWTTFYNEWLFFLFLATSFLLILIRGRLLWVSPVYWVFLSLSIFAHYFLFPGQNGGGLTTPGFFVLYLLVGWLAYIVGWNFRATPYLDLVLYTILLAATLSALIAVLQWSGVVSGENWDTSFILYSEGGGRVSSNIGQANNLGTLLVLGLGVVGYGWYKVTGGKFWHRGLLLTGALLLVLGVYLSGSRTAMLNLMLWPVFFAAWCFFGRSKFPLFAFLPIVLLWALYAVMPVLVEWMGWFPAQEARSMVADDARIRLWKMVLDAISESPWSGNGFGAVANAHLRLSTEYGNIGYVIARQAHNSILDMFSIFGIPLGLLIVLPVGYLWFKAWRACRNVSENFLWLMVTAMLIHGMLELPLHYGFFLWLLFLLLGVLVPQRVMVVEFRRPVSVAFGFFLCLFAASLAIWSAYVQLERVYTIYRQQGPEVTNKLLLAEDFPLRSSLLAEPYQRLRWVTTPLEDLLVLSDDQLSSLEMQASYYPLPALAFRMTLAQAARGNADQAAWWAERMCVMFDPRVCQSAAEEWRRRAADNPQWPALPWERWLPKSEGQAANAPG